MANLQERLITLEDYMDPDICRQILKSVVDLDLDQVEDLLMIERIGDFTMDKVRGAILQITSDIFEYQRQNKPNLISLELFRVVKASDDYKQIDLALYKGDEFHPDDIGRRVYMSYWEPNDHQHIWAPLFEVEFPLEEGASTLYADFNSQTVEPWYPDSLVGTEVYMRDQINNPRYLKKLWQGYQWMARNLLLWEGNEIVSPYSTSDCMITIDSLPKIS